MRIPIINWCLSYALVGVSPSRWSTAFATFLCLILAACATGPQQGDRRRGAEIGEVIDQVKMALADVETDLTKANLPPLKEVKLSLKTTLSKTLGAKLTLLVVTIGASVKDEQVQQIDIVLQPPKPGSPRNVGSQTLTQALEDAIKSAAEGLHKVNAEPYPLVPNSLTATIGFTVEEGGSGEAKPTIAPLTADASGSVTKTSVQTITVSFQTPGKGNANQDGAN